MLLLPGLLRLHHGQLRGVTVENLSHRGKRYFINNRYRLSNRLWQFVFSDVMAQVAEATVGPDAYPLP